MPQALQKADASPQRRRPRLFSPCVSCSAHRSQPRSAKHQKETSTGPWWGQGSLEVHGAQEQPSGAVALRPSQPVPKALCGHLPSTGSCGFCHLPLCRRTFLIIDPRAHSFALSEDGGEDYPQAPREPQALAESALLQALAMQAAAPIGSLGWPVWAACQELSSKLPGDFLRLYSQSCTLRGSLAQPAPHFPSLSPFITRGPLKSTHLMPLFALHGFYLPLQPETPGASSWSPAACPPLAVGTHPELALGG